jgi:hypothetical protein
MFQHAKNGSGITRFSRNGYYELKSLRNTDQEEPSCREGIEPLPPNSG